MKQSSVRKCIFESQLFFFIAFALIDYESSGPATSCLFLEGQSASWGKREKYETCRTGKLVFGYMGGQRRIGTKLSRLSVVEHFRECVYREVLLSINCEVMNIQMFKSCVQILIYRSKIRCIEYFLKFPLTFHHVGNPVCSMAVCWPHYAEKKKQEADTKTVCIHLAPQGPQSDGMIIVRVLVYCKSRIQKEKLASLSIGQGKEGNTFVLRMAYTFGFVFFFWFIQCASGILLYTSQQ